MTIHGDLSASISEYDLAYPEVTTEVVKTILDAADSQDFALRYAADYGTDPVHYWNVIKFLKSTI